MPSKPDTSKFDVIDWLACLGLPEYVQRIPAGHMLLVTGEEYWIDGGGAHLSFDQYMKKWNVNPKIVWQAIKLYRAKKKSHNKIAML